MKTPPLLMAATLAFWGWQTGYIWAGGVLAIVLETSRWVKIRWSPSAVELNRVWDFCVLLFLCGVVYSYASDQFIASSMVFFTWLPIVFFPFMAAQAYAEGETVRVSTFFWLLRKKTPGGIDRPVAGSIVAYLYFALALLSASAANKRGIGFYAVICLLLGWALWSVRSRRYSVVSWAFLFLVAAGLGWAGHVGLHALQPLVEARAARLLTNVDVENVNSAESHTSIGAIGEVKLSSKVVMRVETRSECPLLRGAAYDLYKSPTWHASQRDFQKVQASGTPGSWELLPEKKSADSVKISKYFNFGLGLLPLPPGASRIDNLPAQELERNPFGAVRVVEGPGAATCVVSYGPGVSIDAPPGDNDLKIPAEEQPALSEIEQSLKLESKSPEAILGGIESFFEKNFRYSTYLARPPFDPLEKTTPLGAFLLQNRSGHCEYFASATVLLLRKAGLPARYATGYAVQEFDTLTGTYVVRNRHAHAWALVWINGAWRDFDTTPGTWFSVESKEASKLEPVTDWLSWAWFVFSRWRSMGMASGWAGYLIWLAIPCAAFLLWKIYSRKKRSRPRPKILEADSVWPSVGMDSEFYRIERALAAAVIARTPGETMSGWMAKVDPACPVSPRPLLKLHYRYRFDPRGLAPAEREELRVGVEIWLKEYERLRSTQERKC